MAGRRHAARRRCIGSVRQRRIMRRGSCGITIKRLEWRVVAPDAPHRSRGASAAKWRHEACGSERRRNIEGSINGGS